jgi:hypothetical protein
MAELSRSCDLQHVLISSRKVGTESGTNEMQLRLRIPPSTHDFKIRKSEEAASKTSKADRLVDGNTKSANPHEFRENPNN